MDVAHRRPAETHGGGHVREAGLHQHHVRRVDGHIRPRPDGNAQIGTGEGRGVVDAVAHHGDLAALLQPADHGLLAVGQDAGDHMVDPRLPADGFCCAGVVSG